MRKNFALAMVALLALTIAFAAIGCGGKKAEETTPPPAAQETPAPAADTMMHSDSTAK